VRWHFARHLEDSGLISGYFDKGVYEQELLAPPGKYVHPDGSLLLAWYDHQPEGSVAQK